jgi:selenium metabolism protein YedF
MKDIDCRKMACPQPVLQTKAALEALSEGSLNVWVHNQAAVQHVTRFARSQGHMVASEAVGADYALTITKGAGAAAGSGTGGAPEPEYAACTVGPRLVVRVSSSVMGTGPEDLGRILIKAFLKTLSEASLKPWRVVFYNSGALLAVQGSEHLEALKDLEKSGVELLACGACLDFFGKKDQLAVGRVTNMYEIIETLSAADRVVAP